MTCYDKFLEKLKTIQYLKSLQKLRNQHGAVFALTALLVPVLFGFMGLGYDVGNLYLHKARLQDTADATSLAGARGYVNELKKGSSTGVISLPTESDDTQTKKNNAIAALKTNADNYIVKNNPVFQDKLQNDNRTEKFYSIGKEVTSPDKKKSTEYFRVVLSEPVQLYFLPVIGIKNSANVHVYATTKLSDNEIVEVAGGSNPNDAEYKPVVIAGSLFYDESNTNDPRHHLFDYYNASTVYVKTGGASNVITIDGKKVVPSSHGTIHGKIYPNEETEEAAVDVTYAEVVETDYNMALFGDEIKSLFINKQQQYLSNETLIKQKLQVDYDNDLVAYNQELAEYNTRFNAYENWKNTVYNVWKTQHDNEYPGNMRYNEVKKIYDELKSYYNKNPYSSSSNYEAARGLWNEHGQPISKNFDSLLEKFRYYLPEPQETQPWTWNDNSAYKDTYWNPPPTGPEEPGDAPLAPETVDVRYQKHINDSYYMTYRGDRMDPFKTSSISADPLLSGVEHSFFYLSHSTAGYNSNDTSVTVDGFYINESEGITKDTPFYLFIDEDIKLTNFYIQNTNRPLILFYNGPYETHYFFTDGSANNLRNYRAFIYAPHNAGDTHINGNYINFKGSIVAEKLTVHSQNGEFKYDVDEVKKWQDEGLPVTPNVGFSSSGGESGGEGNEVETEKITIPDRLRLVLADTRTDESHYNKVKVTWTPVD